MAGRRPSANLTIAAVHIATIPKPLAAIKREAPAVSIAEGVAYVAIGPNTTRGLDTRCPRGYL